MKERFPTAFHKKFIYIEVTVLLVAGIAVYWNTFGNTFQLDDKNTIWNNPYIRIESLSFDELEKAAFKSVIPKRPVANISFALNYYFHGLDVTGYHVVNLIVHLAAGLLLYFLVKAIMGSAPVKDRYGPAGLIPLFTALIWLVHPLQVQSVTYIVQRMNSLGAMFFIMAMLFYVKGRKAAETKKAVLFFSASCIAGLLALGSKENSATLPLFIILYEWYFFQDLRLRFSGRQLFWLAGAGFLFLFIVYFYLGGFSMERLTGSYSGRPFTLEERLLTQPRVVVHYLSLLFYPHPGRLNLDYHFPLSVSLLSPSGTILSIALIVSLLAMAVYVSRKNRLYSFCILWFFGNLVIESSVIPLEIIFEHRSYLPSMMAVLLVVVFLHSALAKRRVVVACLVAAALLFSYWTYERNKAWTDEVTLWNDIRMKSPAKARTNLNLGVALLNDERAAEAIPVLEEALEFYMEERKLRQRTSSIMDIFYLRALGEAYKETGEYKKAVRYLDRALQKSSFDGNDVRTFYYLGLCYADMLMGREAVFNLSKALQLAEDNPEHLGAQALLENIRKFLARAQRLLKEQERRKTMQNK